MSPDQPPSPDSPDSPEHPGSGASPANGATPDGATSGTEHPREATRFATTTRQFRQRARHTLHRLRAATARLLTWLSATVTARGSTRHRVHPRMRALQLGTATMALAVLSVLVGGMNAPPPAPKVRLAASPSPLSSPDQSQQARTLEAWAARAAADTGVPAHALRAYAEAAQTLQRERPGCRLPWTVLAGIGRVESNHARFGGATVLDNGRPSDPIVGIALNGSGVQAISDTDNGELDGDTVHDRAVGPMQFIPSTWQSWSTDGNGDGVTDPQNLYDAAATAGNYLCGSARGEPLATEAHQRDALMTYNQSTTYGRKVLGYAEQYAGVEPPPTISR